MTTPSLTPLDQVVIYVFPFTHCIFFVGELTIKSAEIITDVSSRSWRVDSKIENYEHAWAKEANVRSHNAIARADNEREYIVE